MSQIIIQQYFVNCGELEKENSFEKLILIL
jgi:hypothetical protein